MTSHAGKVRSELMELLLSGTPPAPGATLNAARAAGLENSTPLLVLVARASSQAVGRPTLRIAANALARTAGSVIEPLAVVRDDEVVVVLPAPTSDPQAIAASLEALQRRLVDRGIPLAIGASTVHQGLDDVPAAYADACLALEQVRGSGGVLALSGLTVLDYLILRAGDRTAWRLVPPRVRCFVEDDARQGSVLSDTLLAYVACDLSVKLAAEQLFVHPNTAHYRLAKVEARTGCDVRNLGDVQLLTIAIRLRRGNHAI
jgi:DNA-binding PucR family transcriptional regulator